MSLCSIRMHCDVTVALKTNELMITKKHINPYPKRCVKITRKWIWCEVHTVNYLMHLKVEYSRKCTFLDRLGIIQMRLMNLQ